jgi:hypothetical protein
MTQTPNPKVEELKPEKIRMDDPNSETTARAVPDDVREIIGAVIAQSQKRRTS